MHPKKNKLSSLTAPLIVALSGVAGSAVYAEEQRTTVLDEIVVTAQKREESISDVPVALTVLSAAQIDSGFANGIENLHTMIPSLSLRKGGTTRNSAVFFRGIGTTSFSIAVEPSVSTVVDDVIMARSGQAFGDLYDVERIEALRGPQGTLFGKNSSGGVLNIITKGPNSEEWERNIDISVFEDDERRFKASVAGPISDTVSTRITAFAGRHDGSDFNIFSGQNVDGYNRKGIRAMFDIVPSDTFSMRVIGEYYDADDNGFGQTIIPSDESGRANVEAFVDAGRTTDRDILSTTVDKTKALSLKANWELDSHTLTSISAYRVWDNIEVEDADYSSGVTSVWVPGENSGIGTFRKHVIGTQETTQLSQEFRLASNGDGPLQYQVGFLYWDVNTDRTFVRSSHLLCDAAISGDVCDINGLGDLAEVFPEATAVMDVGFKSLALFGQSTYDLSDKSRAIVGLRWTDDEVSYQHDRVNPLGIGAPGIRAADHHKGDTQTNSQLSGRLGFQYDINDNWMAYATYAKGYKGPAYNVTFSMNPTRETPVGPETADSYEIGFKGTAFDGLLFASLSAYSVDYVGFQASNFILVNGSSSSNLTNAGDVTTKGIEADFIANVTENLHLSGGIALGNAEFSKFECIAEATNCVSRKGQSVSFAPDVKGTLGIDYLKELSSFNLHLNTQLSYQSEQYSNLGERDREYLAPRTIWNASIGFSNKEDTSRLSLVLKNLTDENYAAQVRRDAGVLVGIVPREAERYFGVNYRASF